MTNEKKIEKMTFNAFDEIYKTCNKTRRKWRSDGIPLNFLKTVLNKYKIKSKEANSDFINNWNNLLDTFYTTCENACKNMGINNVPTEFLENCIIVIKASYKNGMSSEKAI